MSLIGTILEKRRLALSLLRHPDQYRYIIPWLRSFADDFTLNEQVPWLPFAVIDFVRKRLSHDFRVMEYGSGGSTLFWLRHGGQVVSVEHDAAWWERVHKRIPPNAKLDYRLVSPETASEAAAYLDASDPDGYISSDERFAGYSFKHYVSVIDDYPDNHFDVILIDGRARPSCLKHSVPKVKPGGLVILDNTERTYYLEKAGPYLEMFHREDIVGLIPTLDWFVQSTILTRKLSHNVTVYGA